ncbi:hypothetical protein V1478_001569 [Vespula squamosa]|uniref:Uncharacterized protein n=1 Tax=Vespula squamosa TaxID=30214 RepID=A0ABD2C1T6_VESSQ
MYNKSLIALIHVIAIFSFLLYTYNCQRCYKMLPWATERRDAKTRAVGIVDEINGTATCAMNMKHLEERGGE